MTGKKKTVKKVAKKTVKGKNITLTKTWVGEKQLLTKALNHIFGGNWDFEVLEHGVEGGQVWVKGKLTVHGPQTGQTISKMQFGRVDIKYKCGTKDMLDFGNDLKGAASDALKKCASMFGIASDIYGKGEYKEESGQEPRQMQAPEAQESAPEEPSIQQGDNPPPYEDHVCQWFGKGRGRTGRDQQE